MKRIDSACRADTYAIKHDLPPLAARRNPDTVASMDRWVLVLPGHHAFWYVYVLTGCSLADFPGVPPAIRKFPGATHELLLAAIDPEHARTAIESGEIRMLHPINYAHQVACTDAECNRLLEDLAVAFVNGELLAEPQGVHGARELFADRVRGFLEGYRP